ncbi:MAG: PucR family transcriptional regulator ligand-binding domain-containing protein [Clostridium sp.]|uniref:PucR family transcriptional regulator n=1 Tax=Clostridium culturomicium TaxID=1499683 RepID=UPI00058AD49F|nr:PucR family transcriptional regulator [Clostridium culturomicium]MDU4891375.1 PucR family transcriptional regulator ligand-binding domain-containing protein [Clostridium sp.]MDU7085065.1 PucR family transcriptional regulator ligand-binding domain-containing protein [Clostridium sp.]
MSLTVRQALMLEGMNKCNILAGHTGLDNPISYVGSMEIPDIKPWLIKNQLLITTGYALRNTPSSIIKLVEDLHSAECSALAIKSRFTGPIPVEALEIANKLSIPLIEIPENFNFIDIVGPLTKALTDEHSRQLEFSQHIHSKFLELEISGEGLPAITKMLSMLMKSNVEITKPNFTPICINDNNEESPLTRLDDFIKTKLGELEKFSLCNETTFLFENKIDHTITHFYIARKILLQNTIRGYIFIDSTEKPNDMTNIIIDHAATVCALEFSKLAALNEQRKMMENNLLIDIITGNIKSDEAIYRATNFKWPTPPFSLIIFDIYNFENLTTDLNETSIQNLKTNVNLIIQESFNTHQDNSRIIIKNDSFICLISGNKSKIEIENILKIILHKSSYELNVSLLAGAYQYIDSYGNLRYHYEDVRDAITILRAKGLSEGYLFISDARLEQTILHLSHKTFLKDFVNETVAKLKNYDKINGTELLHTLSVFIKNMGIKSNTAEELFIHRNTLAYRLKFIEKLINYDLSNPENLFSLGVVIKAQKYIDFNKSV